MLGLLVKQMFFETPKVRYYCDFIQYMFLFVSVSVNMSLSPLPTKFKVLRLWYKLWWRGNDDKTRGEGILTKEEL